MINFDDIVSHDKVADDKIVQYHRPVQKHQLNVTTQTVFFTVVAQQKINIEPILITKRPCKKTVKVHSHLCFAPFLK